MRNLRAVHEDKEKIAEKDWVAKVHTRVAEAQAQVRKWMEEFDEQDSKRVNKLGGSRGNMGGTKSAGKGARMIKKGGGGG